MKSIFDDLDSLIESAVAKATQTEKSLQDKQQKAIEQRGLKAETEKGSADEVDEADEEKDSEKKSPDDESIKKIKGEPPKEKGETSKSDSKGKEIPGTKTSKKLEDPPSKTIADPKFSDISSKVNALRGSGSLKDEKVSSAVKSYLGTLQPAERSALLTYLTNLAQIMATVKSPKDVKDPREVGIETTFKKKIPIEKTEEPQKSKSTGVIVVGGK